MENLDPQIKDGKMARFCLSRGFILDLGGWGFAVPFYFVQDCRLTDRFAKRAPRGHASPDNFLDLLLPKVPSWKYTNHEALYGGH